MGGSRFAQGKCTGNGILHDALFDHVEQFPGPRHQVFAFRHVVHNCRAGEKQRAALAEI
jgi:hypothetical protein